MATVSGEISDGMTSVSVVVVSYNSASTILQCVNSVPASAEVVVVDQASRDGSAKMVASACPRARVINAGGNRGFAAGCNLGAANASGEVIVFLNPDAFLESGSLEKLVEAAVRENALVGPKILDARGCDDTRARNWSTMSMDLLTEVVPRKYAVGKLARDIPNDSPIYKTGGRVPYVQGSCMAVQASHFWAAGAFDERFFLYYEEESLARALQSIDVPMMLEPRAVITHAGAVSTSQRRYFAISQLYRSRAMYYSIYQPGIRTIAFTWSLLLLLKLMALVTPLRRVVGLRGYLDREWYVAAASGVMSGRTRRVVEPPM